MLGLVSGCMEMGGGRERGRERRREARGHTHSRRAQEWSWLKRLGIPIFIFLYSAQQERHKFCLTKAMIAPVQGGRQHLGSSALLRK